MNNEADGNRQTLHNVYEHWIHCAVWYKLFISVMGST